MKPSHSRLPSPPVRQVGLRSLQLPAQDQASLRLKTRRRGLEESQGFEALLLLQIAGGDCPEDIVLLQNDACLERSLGFALPKARTDDGLLDAFLIRKCSFSRLAYLALLTPPAVYAEKKEAIVLQAPRFLVRADKPFTVQIDGEILNQGGQPRPFRSLEFASVPRALTIIS